MRATIEHKTATSGMFSKKEQRQVQITVQFSAEEKAIITANDLADYTVLSRDPPAGTKNSDVEHYGREFYYLTLDALLNGPQTYPVDSNGHAKHYAAELVEAMEKLKAVIEVNREIGERMITIEL